MSKRVMFTCDECGYDVEDEYIDVPDGWEEINGYDYCEECSNEWHEKRTCEVCNFEEDHEIEQHLDTSDRVCDDCLDEYNEELDRKGGK